jgi:hypothetical protein
MTKELTQVESQPPGPLGRWKIALRHPAARLPILVGAAFALAYLVIAHSLLFLATAAIGLLGGGVAAFFLSAAGNRWVARQLESGANRLALDARTEEHDRLKRALGKLKWEESVEKPAEQAVGQLEQLASRFDLFEKALRSKMNPGELTYERYSSTAHSVRNAVLQNLQSILLSLQSLVTIAPTEQALRAAESSKLQSLLSGNDLALTRLMEATQALSDIKTSRDSAAVNLDATLQELKELAARASKYSS